MNSNNIANGPSVISSSSALELAQQQILSGGLALHDVERALGLLAGPGIDAADLYFQFRRSESWVLEDGIVKDGSHDIEKGVGARAISGDKAGLAYTDELHFDALAEAAGAARAIANSGALVQPVALKSVAAPERYAAVDPVAGMSSTEKVALLRELDALARQTDPIVQQVTVSLSANSESILVAALDGTLAGDVRPLVRLNVSVIVEKGGKREQGVAGAGGRYALEKDRLMAMGRRLVSEAVRMAQVNLQAVDAPAGMMPVVLGPGWPGVLLHEAIGHGLEGDFNRKKTSAFAGRVGQQVASPLCTVVDDGTLDGRRGSLTVDDEGVPCQNTVLIENGILRGYMQDKLNARLMGEVSTGNGRRESFAHMPMPRMTNTYMLAGESDPEEIIRSVKRGLYAVNFGGGQVDITSGSFVFSASEAYLVENGKVTTPVKGATLIGSGPEALKHVSMVGNDLALDDGVGVCGKDGQSVPVGVGQPTMLVDELTVGGTA